MMKMSLGMIAGTAVALSATSGVLAEVNSDEVRAMVAEIMADANSRSSNLAGGADAGHDGKKFYISDGSGDFRLNVGGQIQFRYMLNLSDEGAADGDDNEDGFQTRRTKLWFQGDAFGDMFYMVKGAFDRDGGAFSLEDAYVGTNIDENMSIRWGQFKAPFLREELVSSTKQLAADRSLTNEIFNQDYSQGVEWAYAADDFNITAMFSDGFGSRNTDYNNPAEADWAITVRGEYKFAGTWDQFGDFTGAAGQDYGAMLGGAIHYQDSDDADVELLGYTLDISVEGDGWNFFAAGVGASSEIAGDDFDDFGVVVQGGMMFPDSNWEIFGRWDILFPDSSRTNDDEFNTITVGVNNYIHGHAAKFTFDVQWFLNDSNGLSGPNTGIGFVADDDENELAFRAQFQLLF